MSSVFSVVKKTNTITNIAIILLFSGVVAFVSNLVHPRKIPWVQHWSNHVEAKARKATISVIPLSTALQKFEHGNAVFIDARPKEEFIQGHIPTSISLPFQELDDQFEVVADLLDNNTDLIIYCKNRECDDGLLLAMELKAMGMEKLSLMVDGFELWSEYGGATVAGGTPAMRGEIP